MSSSGGPGSRDRIHKLPPRLAVRHCHREVVGFILSFAMSECGSCVQPDVYKYNYKVFVSVFKKYIVKSNLVQVKAECCQDSLAPCIITTVSSLHLVWNLFSKKSLKTYKKQAFCFIGFAYSCILALKICIARFLWMTSAFCIGCFKKYMLIKADMISYHYKT